MAKILVVDDSTMMRRNLGTLLTKIGHTIVGEAANGEQAYHRYKTLRPDLVTMDITMPVSSGIEALEKIMKEDPEAKVIMVSALNQKNMVLEALEKGAKHYIIKPIVVDNIVNVVNKVLGASSSLPAQEVPEKPVQEEPCGEKKSTASADSGTKSPFNIENIDNTFQISISSSLNDESFEMLNRAFQGLLFVRPLNVKLYFGSTDALAEQLLEKLGGLVIEALEAKGKVEVVSQSKVFIESVKNKNVDGLANIINLG